MKTGIVVVLLIFISLIPALSCVVTSHDTHVEISCEEFTESPTSIRNDFTMEIGDKLYVELCSNPSTGFEWSYEMTGDAAVMEEDYDFEPPQENLPGAGGIAKWTFEAIDIGTTLINMEYSQQWDGGMKAAWTYKITVVVE